MSNLKICRLALVLVSSLFFVTGTEASAKIRGGNTASCYSSNIQHTNKNCRGKKLITHTKKTASTKSHRPKTSVPSPKGSIYSEAARYVGFNERRNTQSLTKLTGVNPRRTPWCAAFVNAMLNKNGYRGTNSHAASSFINYGVRVSTPSQGDIVVIRSRSSGSGKHVGIFYGYKTIRGVKHIGLLGGNQSNMVKVTYYPARSVIAIRRPVAAM